MLTLTECIKNHLEDTLVCFSVLTVLYIIQAIADAVGIVDVRKKRRCKLIIGHIRLFALDLLDELATILWILQNKCSEVASFITAKLQEVVFEDMETYMPTAAPTEAMIAP